MGSFLLVGCGYSSVTLDSNKKNELKGKTITVIHKNGPVRPTNYGGGGITIESKIISGLSADAASRQNDGPVYGNPSDVLNKKIISYLIKKYSLKYKENRFAPQVRDSDSIAMMNTGKPNYAAMKKYNTDYVLEVNSYWQLQNLMMGAQFVRLRNDIRLMDNKKHKIVAQLTCDTDIGGNIKLKKNSFSRDELYAHNGALLKKVTSEAINLCVEEVKLKAFK